MNKAARQRAYTQGVDAEHTAAQFLRLKGYKILEQRYKTPHGEIDIIAQKKDAIVFAEVKSHKDEEAALMAVTPKTRRRIEVAASYFIAENAHYNDYAMRFDVLVVPQDIRPNLLGAISVRHLDNAWMCGQ